MCSIPDNVRQDLVNFVPASIINEISCFVFYDNHPRNQTKIEIIVCTIRGEIREYFQRELVYSTIIERCSKPGVVKILRNSKCELFYLVSYDEEIVVLSRRKGLEILHRIDNVDSYEVEDAVCSGQACLKLIRKDDAVPLIFDDNFESLSDRAEILNKWRSDDSLPIITQLARKLTEAKYTVKCNEKAYNDLMKLRQLVYYEKTKGDQKHALACKSTQSYVYKCCNNLVIVTEVINNSYVLAEDVHYLVHSNTEPTISYTTRLFNSTTNPPYWQEVITINPQSTTCIALIINLKEFNYSKPGRFKIYGEISYKCNGQENLLKFPGIDLSPTDMMSKEADITKRNSNDLKLLSMLAVTQKTDLKFRHISQDVPDFNLLKLFQRYLQMELIASENGTMDVVFKNSPFNILDGVIVYIRERVASNSWSVSLHTRKQHQILAFIHYVHDAVPYRLLVTTTDQKVTSKLPELNVYDENITCEAERWNFKEFGASVGKQATLTLAYLDECMIKMNESKNAEVLNKIGREIDIFAGDFSSFKNSVLEEAEKGVRSLKKTAIDEGMVIDID